MKLHFLFPQSSFHTETMIDMMFVDQALALRAAGFETSLITDEMKILGPLSKPKICDDPDVRVVYRGWMMNADDYQTYVDRLAGRSALPFTTRDQYLATHHLPNWYAGLRDLTPETVVFPITLGFEAIIAGILLLDWEKYQLKDYVKSLKTMGGSVLTRSDQLPQVLANMEKYRNGIEGGICVRRWEDFKPGSEMRFFILDGKFYGPGKGFDLRVYAILRRLCSIDSPFFSVDIAQRTDGEYRVVEIGDGQVSDIVGWDPERFAEMWKTYA